MQKVALNIILSDASTGRSEYSYEMALVILNIEPLEDRRLKLCSTFAKKTLKSRHKDMFSVNASEYQTRHKNQLVESRANTKRFFNSPLNYLTRLLNRS